MPLHPAKASAKLSSCKQTPRKSLSVQDAVNLLEPGDAGLHIDGQIGRIGHNILSTSPVCHSSSILGLGVKFDRVHEDKYAWTYTGI